ncbi:MAG: biliverdin-producing heme oxygenase [Granulosicoccus sp.]
MSENNDHSGSIRKALAEHTRIAHETLHTHHWISRLASPTLTFEQYHLVLHAYLHFYRHIELERRRLGEFDQFSLHDAVTCLESDTACISSLDRDDLPGTQKIRLKNDHSALGALYVLHGARFGAAIMNKQVSKSLPESSRKFLQNSTPLQQWKNLTDAIESTGTVKSARQDLFSGANETFSAFGSHVTEHCEFINAMATH